MTSEKPQPDPFLAAIDAKIAAWTAVRDSYLTAASTDGPLSLQRSETVSVKDHVTAHMQTVRRSGTGPDLAVGVFRDKSLKEAIPIYLAAGRRKQTDKEIAVGLETGGYPTTADNFEATVGTALYRLKKDGVLLRFPDGWDLASSYPDSLRNRLEKDTKPRPTKAKKRAPRKSAKAAAQKNLVFAGTNAQSELKAVG